MRAEVAFLAFVIPAIGASILVFLAFGFMGFCGLTGCLGQARPSTAVNLLLVAGMLAGTLPLLGSVSVLVMHFREKRIGSVGRALIWAVILAAGAFGVFQILVDPGDAVFMGIPSVAFAVLFASAMRFFPGIKLH